VVVEVIVKFRGGGGTVIKQASSEQKDDYKIFELNIETSGI
jgi:hypothetical protein